MNWENLRNTPAAIQPHVETDLGMHCLLFTTCLAIILPKFKMIFLLCDSDTRNFDKFEEVETEDEVGDLPASAGGAHGGAFIGNLRSFKIV